MLSLTRLASISTRQTLAMRLLAAWFALSVTLTFTPCCKLWAATPQSDHAVSETEHGHDAPGDLPDPCATFLDHADFVATAPGIISSTPDRPPAFFGVPPAPLFHTAMLAGSPQHRGQSPPHPSVPLYLRIARLLI